MMLLSKRLWAVLLAAVLVAGLLVGFGDGEEAIAKEPRATIGKIMIPPAAFSPLSDHSQYTNQGGYVIAGAPATKLVAPVSFPVPEVWIRKITLVAWDTMGGNVCVRMSRAQPFRAVSRSISLVCTVEDPANPQRIATTELRNRRVNTVNHGPYLQLNLNQGTFFYGVQVVYTY
jgi:hypothetical protein